MVAALTVAIPPSLIAQGTTITARPVETPTAKPAQTPTAKPATTTAATPAGTAAVPTPPDWPRAYSMPSGSLTLYQPQVDSWEGQKKMVAWSAVSYTEKGATKAELGTIKIEATTKVAMDERLVNFSDFSITESSFPTLSRDKTRDVVAGLQQAVPDSDRIIELDRVLAAVDKSSIRPKEAVGIKADPPKIFFSTKPAILVAIDGTPIWSPIKDVDLEYVVNTNWDLFQHTPTKTFYLRADTGWLKAMDLIGPWTPAGKLPDSFKKLPSDDNFKDAKANVPGKSISPANVPNIFYTTEPSELLLLTGEPTYESVDGTSLFWVNNTEADVFRVTKTGNFYFLIAGRWFTAPNLTGPWTFATPTLPADFTKIPLEHPRSRVRASVPGTDEAKEAVLVASIPQTARVNIKEVKAPEVKYQGDPKFETITPTKMERAVNTDKDIIKVGALYYMCFQAVWFMSKTATGPWEVATTVPAEIYTIPSSSPVYNVTYVTVEDDDTTDEWVTFAYVAGYTGMMIAWGCAVWGTGWYYPPYAWYGGFYPGYYPYPRTYGYGAWYNPYTGAYGRGYAAYGPYGGVAMGARYNPTTGTYSRGATAYGPYGSRSYGQAYNPRTGTYAQTRQGSNVYGNWGSTSVQRGDSWAQAGHVTSNRTGNTTSGVRGSGGGEAIQRDTNRGQTTVGRTGGGDVYAGHDGSVYKKGSDGGWQKWDNGGWNNVNTPSPTERTGDRAGDRGGTASAGQLGSGNRTGQGGTAGASTRPSNPSTGQLDRDAAARSSGNSRTSNLGTYRSQPTRSNGGSYGRSGGMSRGGGGRRR